MYRYKSGNLEDARKIFEYLLEIKPGDELTLRNLGLVYYNLNENEKAKEYFEKYLELYPDSDSKEQIELILLETNE